MTDSTALIHTILALDETLRTCAHEVMSRMGYTENQIRDAENEEHTLICKLVDGLWECYDEHPDRDQLQDIAEILKIGFEVLSSEQTDDPSSNVS